MMLRWQMNDNSVLRRNERGVALLIVLLVTGLLIALIFEFSYATRISLNSAVNFRDSQQADILAQSGIRAFIRVGKPLRDYFTGTMKNWPDLRNGELRVIPTADYEMCLLPLANIDTANGIARTTVAASRPMGRVKFMNETVWVENLLEVLDEPGEWVFDSAERKLYLWPVGDAPSDRIVAPQLTELVRVEGGIDYSGPTDQTVNGLVFRGLTFTCGERRPWHGATKGELQHKWEHFDSPTALVRFRGVQKCQVQSCR